MPFWFSLIHPDDLPLVTGKIIEAHAHLTRPWQEGQEGPGAFPLLLTYRIKHRNGKDIRIRDTRYLLSANQENIVDNIICRIETIRDTDTRRIAVNESLQTERCGTKMLVAAILHQAGLRKPTLKPTPSHPGPNGSAVAPPHTTVAPAHMTTVPNLTAREKEILRLIADGLSSKMIAGQCRISKNTVETHRRHLLEKLGAKNSMELVKEASKVFVL